MDTPAPPTPAPASREGVVEYLIVVAFVALAIVGALTIFGEEIRAALGTPPVRPTP